MSMNKVYEDAKDLHVKKYVVYGDEDGDLYIDSDLKTRAKKVDVVDAFNKGLLMIIQGENSYVPVTMSGDKLYNVKAPDDAFGWWNIDENINTVRDSFAS